MPQSNRNPASNRPLGLFEAVGLELEYMIVSTETLDAVPAADRLLEALAGEPTDEYENGDVAWNNELALHVIELKCNGPRPALEGLAEAFQGNVAIAEERLAREDLRLMPGAMHPWMDPLEVRLWPHGSKSIYEAFDRVFGCKGHGWANLQSAHVNLPFADDEQFGRLHAAVRLLLPILPGLAASSPALDGELNGVLDNRLVVYRTHCAKIPSITGNVIPEPIYSMDEYREQLLERLYADLAPHDPEGVLRHEWVNARGAIARFDRSSLEIRLLDVQECPAVDVAYAALIAATLKSLCEERWSGLKALQAWPTRRLAQLLEHVERRAEHGEIGDPRYLQALGYRGTGAGVGKLWEHLIESAAERGGLSAADGRILEHYLRHGTLATRIVKALGPAPRQSGLGPAPRQSGLGPAPRQSGLGPAPRRRELRRVYGQLCDALAAGTPFVVGS